MNSVLKKVYVPMWDRLCARRGTVGNISENIWQNALDKINYPASEIVLDIFIELIKEEIKEETKYHIPLVRSMEASMDRAYEVVCQTQTVAISIRGLAINQIMNKIDFGGVREVLLQLREQIKWNH